MYYKKREELKCPQCNSRLVKRKSKYGEFWGCSRFPKCNFKAKIYPRDEKVVLNPATHARNIVSNLILNWWNRKNSK